MVYAVAVFPCVCHTEIRPRHIPFPDRMKIVPDSGNDIIMCCSPPALCARNSRTALIEARYVHVSSHVALHSSSYDELRSRNRQRRSMTECGVMSLHQPGVITARDHYKVQLRLSTSQSAAHRAVHVRQKGRDPTYTAGS